MKDESAGAAQPKGSLNAAIERIYGQLGDEITLMLSFNAFKKLLRDEVAGVGADQPGSLAANEVQILKDRIADLERFIEGTNLSAALAHRPSPDSESATLAQVTPKEGAGGEK